MICENPYTQGARAFGCGACVPCRVKRKRVWQTRIVLEASLHPRSSFATLTYSDDNLIYSVQARAPTLIPNDLKLWLKRLRIESVRKLRLNSRLRFYAAGEYGDALGRPHFHVVLFGYPPCAYGGSRYRDGRTFDCCAPCDLIRDTWGKGIVELLPLTPGRSAYAAGYVMKKMTHKSDVRLNGRHPEFSRMSLKPGLAADMAASIARPLVGQDLKDVPAALRWEGKLHPLGRYIRRLVRIQLGGDGSAPLAVIQEMERQMLPLLEAAKRDPQNPSLKWQIIKEAQTKIDSIKAQEEIFNSRRRNRSL